MGYLALIAAIGENNEIGCNNKLLWKLKGDMKLFRTMTTGNVVVMGSNTFDSIGKPLPNRTNVILTKDDRKTEYYRSLGCFVAHSVEEVLEMSSKTNENFFIIGGASVYEQFVEHADMLMISKVEASFGEADAFFPEIDFSEWRACVSPIEHKADKDNEYSFSANIYFKK